MMTGDIFRHKKKFVFYLLLLCFSNTALFAQGDSLIINTYAKVTSRADYQVTVDNATGFHDGDYALIIQMKGVSIVPDNSNGYGLISQILGVPGQYEFIIINTVIGNTITFLSKIKQYNTDGFVQIVQVPFFNSAKFDKTLTCQKWDSAKGTGGVLAMIVGRDLTLTKNIDVSGKGFKGGVVDLGDGLCSVSGGDYSYPADNLNSGYKGEGIASHYTVSGIPILLPSKLKGQGSLFNGGGGGNGKFAGGGGGSNRGQGNNGGRESSDCIDPSVTDGGKGGLPVNSFIDTTSFTGGVFMGGGGGSSTHLNTATATSGGNGGGIIFIIADTIKGNSNSILASGDSARTATGIYSGAGGGGAGGSIVIFSQSYSSTNINIRANGAKGGDVYHLWSTLEGGGSGGSGGGGYVALLKSPTEKVMVSFDGGDESLIKYSGFPNDTVPSIIPIELKVGLSRTGINPVLTGFLFNSISSDVTGNQIDSICSHVSYSTLKGTEPMGGTPGYSFQWQKSTVSGSTGFADIPGAASKDYSPGQLSQTTWFQRIVTDQSTTPIVDVSRPVQIIVQQAIQNNSIVASPDTICYGQDPKLIKQGTPDLIVPSTSYLKYIWQDSTSGVDWGTDLPADNLKEYDPNPSGGLIIPTWYRRTVISGRCVDKGAGSKARIMVLPEIGNNAFSQLYDTICFGGNTSLNTSAGPTGGDGIFRYLWESNSTGPTGPWSPVIPSQTSASFDPDASVSLPVGDHYYRRKVFSGELNACQDSSAIASRKVLPVITNNLIQADQTICANTAFLSLSGTTASPVGGAGTYSYLWEQSPNGTTLWTNATGNITGNTYSSPVPSLTLSTWYRRTVNSGLFNNNPVCTNTSPPVAITVQPAILNNSVTIFGSGADTTICNGQNPNQLIKTGPALSGGDGVNYAFQWAAATSETGLYTDITGATNTNYSPGGLFSSRYFKMKVTSGTCLSESNIINVNVLEKLAGFNIEQDQAICKNLPLPALNSVAPGPTGGDGTYRYKWVQNVANAGWTDITLNSTSASYSKSSIADPTDYKRYIYSGPLDCCRDTSNIVSISILPIPAAPDPGPDTTISSLGRIYQMKAAPPLAGETGAWTTVSGDGKTDDNSYNTYARELNGTTTFLWTVTKGTCSLDSTVVITLGDDNKAIPQGFSPNYDQVNDVFKIDGLYKKDETVQLSVVNGAGTEVFTTSSVSGDSSKWKDWDGRNSAGIELPEGTYYYILKVTTSKGYVTRKSGFIILKRY
jgi:gliding motility-associated-like protein